MCGIVGLINRDGSAVKLALLSAMAETIKHRGPDEEGHLIEGSVGFYHKRLSIIDLVSGRQPMTDGPASIVFNGEIYNYIELREALRKRGHSFATNSDTEVILKLYLEYGEECVRFLNGMFAFLVYDRRRNRIVAARDHFGIKPLYFTANEHAFIFASEIKAMLVHPSVAASADYDAIQEYLIFQYVLSPQTLFRGIQKVLPGHYLVLDLDASDVKDVKYWEPDFTVDTESTEEFFSLRLRELLEDSVRIQLRSDVPLGTHLSGGIDSSIITALAVRMSGQPLKSFTGAFHDGPQFDETPYAREVASFCGAHMFEVFPTEAEFIDLLPRLAYLMDEPAAGPGLFPQYMVARLASREVKVVLGGQGGDEIFGGYTRYVIAYLEQALKGAIFETNDEGEHIVSLKSILPNLPSIREYVPMLRRFLQSGLFDPMEQRYFHLIDRSAGEPGFMTEEFRKTFVRDRIFSLFQGTFNNPNTLSYYNKMVNFDLRANLPALLQVEDRVSMAVSLESRVPFLDYRVVELVARMPPAVKFRGAEMKYILKKAARDLLPRKIVERKDKMGFPVPLHLWARNRLREFIQDILLSPACRQRGLFDPDYVKTLIDREEEFGRRLWGLLNLELWFQTFIDGPNPDRT